MAEPAAAWRADPPAPAAQPAAGGGPRNAERIDAEARKAEADFRSAAGKTEPGRSTAAARRSAALQTFFVANAGRSLLPAGETSGAVSPQLKSEEP